MFLYYTYRNFSIEDLVLSLNSINILSLFVYFFFFIPIILILSVKFIILISSYKKMPLKSSININLISSFYNIFFPAKLGDILRIFYSKISKKNYANCLALTFLEKIVSFLSLVSLIIVFKEFNTSLILFSVIIFLTLAIVFFTNKFYEISNFLNTILNKFLKKKIMLNKKNSINFKGNLIIFFTLDTIVWLLIFAQVYIISYDLNINLKFAAICYIFGYSILLGLVPISFGGFGIRDILIYKSLEGLISNQEILILLFFFNLRYFIPAIVGFLINFKQINVK